MPDASANTRQTFAYFGWLTLFVYLATPAGYLVDIQTSYMLKNQLHAITFGLNYRFNWAGGRPY